MQDKRPHEEDKKGMTSHKPHQYNWVKWFNLVKKKKEAPTEVGRGCQSILL